MSGSNTWYKWRERQHLRTERVCEECGRDFFARKWAVLNKGKGRFCSNLCKNTYNGKQTENLQARVRERTQADILLRQQAHNQVTLALKYHVLHRSACEICGNPKTDAHHDDYTDALAVRWLCRRHHQIEHGAAG